MQNKFFRMIDRVPTLIVFATFNSLIGLTFFIIMLIWQLFTEDLNWFQYLCSAVGIIGLGGLLSFIVGILWEEWKDA